MNHVLDTLELTMRHSIANDGAGPDCTNTFHIGQLLRSGGIDIDGGLHKPQNKCKHHETPSLIQGRAGRAAKASKIKLHRRNCTTMTGVTISSGLSALPGSGKPKGDLKIIMGQRDGAGTDSRIGSSPRHSQMTGVRARWCFFSTHV
jgi:hypothetical protein